MSNTVKTFECGKCSGTGRIEAFGHYDNGKCYGCMGAGTVEGLNVSDQTAATARAWHTISSLEDAVTEGVNNPTWITHMCKRAAKDMLAMQDTQTARKMLARVPTLRAEIIAVGRVS